MLVLALAYGTTRGAIDMGGLTLGEWTTRVKLEGRSVQVGVGPHQFSPPTLVGAL